MSLNIVNEIDDFVKINNIIVSVSDKNGLDLFIERMVQINPDIRLYSTGGTYKFLSGLKGIYEERNLVSVADYTRQPEMQGGLVKTLDFRIYTGILSEKYNKDHQDDLKRTESVEFDMVVVNLYPFEKTVSSAVVTPEMARTNIDIGGPCMLRASAKNYHRVASVCSPSYYNDIVTEMEKNNGCLSLETRFRLSCSTFSHTALYDKAISGYFSSLENSFLKKTYTIH